MTHDNEYLAKLREHERYLDRLQEQHNGEYDEEEEYVHPEEKHLDIELDDPRLERHTR